MRPQRCAIWWAFWRSRVVIRPYFENEVGIAVTVYRESHRVMLNDFFFHQIDDVDLNNAVSARGAT